MVGRAAELDRLAAPSRRGRRARRRPDRRRGRHRQDPARARAARPLPRRASHRRSGRSRLARASVRARARRRRARHRARRAARGRHRRAAAHGGPARTRPRRSSPTSRRPARRSSCSTTCTGPTRRARRCSSASPSPAAGSPLLIGTYRPDGDDPPPARGADAARASNAGGRSPTCTSNGSASPRSWRSSPRSTGGRRRTGWPRPCTPAPAAIPYFLEELLAGLVGRRSRPARTRSRCRGASASSCAASSTSSSPTNAASSRRPRCSNARVSFDVLAAVTATPEDELIDVLRSLVASGMLVESRRRRLQLPARARPRGDRGRPARPGEAAAARAGARGAAPSAGERRSRRDRPPRPRRRSLRRDGRGGARRARAATSARGSTYQALQLAELGLSEAPRRPRPPRHRGSCGVARGPERGRGRACRAPARRRPAIAACARRSPRALRRLVRLRWELGDRAAMERCTEQPHRARRRASSRARSSATRWRASRRARCSGTCPTEAIEWADRAIALADELDLPVGPGLGAVREGLGAADDARAHRGGHRRSSSAVADDAEAVGEYVIVARALNNRVRTGPFRPRSRRGARHPRPHATGRGTGGLRLAVRPRLLGGSRQPGRVGRRPRRRHRAARGRTSAGQAHDAARPLVVVHDPRGRPRPRSRRRRQGGAALRRAAARRRRARRRRGTGSRCTSRAGAAISPRRGGCCPSWSSLVAVGGRGRPVAARRLGGVAGRRRVRGRGAAARVPELDRRRQHPDESASAWPLAARRSAARGRRPVRRRARPRYDGRRIARRGRCSATRRPARRSSVRRVRSSRSAGSTTRARTPRRPAQLLEHWRGWRVDDLHAVERRLGIGPDVAGPDCAHAARARGRGAPRRRA